MPTRLSPRQAEILQLLATGLDNKTIARELNLSIKTVKNQLVFVYKKMGVENRTQAVLRYRSY